MSSLSSKTRKLPDSAIKWVIGYLTSKVGCCEICTNNKPYKGLSKRATAQLNQNGVIDCLTVVEIKMLFYELDGHLHDSILNFKLCSKYKPKSTWINDFITLFFTDNSCNKVAQSSAPIWQAIRSSSKIIRGTKSTNTSSVIGTNVELNSNTCLNRETSINNLRSFNPPYTHEMVSSSLNHSYTPNHVNLPYQQVFTSHAICDLPISSNSINNNRVEQSSQSIKVNNQEPSLNKTSATNSTLSTYKSHHPESKKNLHEHGSNRTDSSNDQQQSTTNNLMHNKFKRVKIKKEKENQIDSTFYYENHPRDIQESSLLNELLAMGFTSTREALSGIRYVVASCSGEGSILEQAMIRIVSQREEADEARRLDEARISSEVTREEEIIVQAQFCKSQELETLLTAPNDIILLANQSNDKVFSEEKNNEVINKNPFFPLSIVLNSTDLQPTLSQVCSNSQEGRNHVIKFLTLEKKAIKWYGLCTTFCYFKYNSLVGAYSEILKDVRINSNYDKSMISILRKENKNLERALFSLSEQDMNVPKIFLEAKKSAKSKNLPMNPESELINGKNDEKDFNEVTIVEVFDLEKKKGPNGIEKKHNMDIIELL